MRGKERSKRRKRKREGLYENIHTMGANEGGVGFFLSVSTGEHRNESEAFADKKPSEKKDGNGRKEGGREGVKGTGRASIHIFVLL